MRTADEPGLRGVLDRLGNLCDDPDREALAALRERLDSARLRVLVVGEAKRGKSTLVNALLGRDVLPVGATPLTAVAATVGYAQPGAEGIEVRFAEGGTGRFSLTELDVFGTERGNPGNRRCVSTIRVGLTAPILARGVEIVDTPGIGSVHAHNTAAADAALPTMDAAIFVLTADPPVSASERELLRQVSDLSVALFVVLNKTDYLDEAALTEAVEFTAGVVAEATSQPDRVYPLSARAGLGAPGDPGFTAFASDFMAFLDDGRIAGLELAVTRHARRVAQQLLDEVALARRAARLPGEQAEAQLGDFSRRLAEVTDGRVGAEDRAAAQSGRLLEALNATAEQVRLSLSAEVGYTITGLLGGELTAASADEIARRGRAHLIRMVADGVEAWRQAQAGLLEHGLREIHERLAAELEAELAAVRSAAADLLGLELALPSPGDRLAPGPSFCYPLREQVDQAELLAGAIRRRVPGEYGRRLAGRRLLAELPDLVSGQVGRARGDLQYRLAEATRQLLADVRRRYTSTTERLTAALERAAVVRAAAGEQGELLLGELAVRERALRAVLDQLSIVGTVSAGAPAGCSPSQPPIR